MALMWTYTFIHIKVFKKKNQNMILDIVECLDFSAFFRHVTCSLSRQTALFAVTPGVAVTAVRRAVDRNHGRNPAVWRHSREKKRRPRPAYFRIRGSSLVLRHISHRYLFVYWTVRAVNQRGREGVDVISSVNQGNLSILLFACVPIDDRLVSPLENKLVKESTGPSGGRYRYNGCF